MAMRISIVISTLTLQGGSGVRQAWVPDQVLILKSLGFPICKTRTVGLPYVSQGCQEELIGVIISMRKVVFCLIEYESVMK